MEHKLIQGGELWLPFARSRIKALRATGLPYASQKFIMPDGALCAVWIEPGQEYIRISGSDCSLMLDSGIVTFSPSSFNIYDDGILNEVGSVQTYHSLFSLSPPNAWRTNPSNSNVGQAAGFLRSRIRGMIPPDAQAAACLSAAWEGSGATLHRNTADDAMLMKKVMMTTCPPSIFTGRCRLYVQAMYGLPVYKDTIINKLGVPTRTVHLPNTSGPSLAPDLGGSPSLLVPAFSQPGDKTGYAPVPLNTSTGVILDSATGHHWMVDVSTDTAWFWPLVASSCGEGLRRYLVPDTAEYNSINDEDRTHVEAYILSSSQPFPEYAKTVPFSGGPITTWSMGYGWHWNWSGTTAVIVTLAELWTALVPSTDTHMQSDYFSASIVNVPLPADVDPKGGYADKFGRKEWQFNVVAIETKKYWTAVRQYWAVLEPVWSLPSMLKVTPFHTTAFTCDAPIYAFFNVDELNVVRVNISSGLTEDIITSNSPYPPGGVSTAYGGGYIDERRHVGGLMLTVSIGGASYGPMYKSVTWTHDRTEDSAKWDDPSYADPSPGALSWATYTAPFSLTYSDSPTSGPTAHTISAGPGAAAMQVSTGAVPVPIMFNETRTHSSISSDSAVVLAAPWYDSEAFYILNDNTELDTPSSSTVTLTKTPYGHTRAWVRASGDPGLGAAYDSYYGLNLGGTNGANQTVTTVSTTGGDLTPIATAVNNAKLYCRGGALDALQKTTGVWDSNDDLTYSEFVTYSGFNQIRPAVIAPTILDIPLNIEPSIITGKDHAFVGWV